MNALLKTSALFIVLMMITGLAKLHGSVLHIESEEGKGSRFWFNV